MIFPFLKLIFKTVLVEYARPYLHPASQTIGSICVNSQFTEQVELFKVAVKLNKLASGTVRIGTSNIPLPNDPRYFQSVMHTIANSTDDDFKTVLDDSGIVDQWKKSQEYRKKLKALQHGSIKRQGKSGGYYDYAARSGKVYDRKRKQEEKEEFNKDPMPFYWPQQ